MTYFNANACVNSECFLVVEKKLHTDNTVVVLALSPGLGV